MASFKLRLISTSILIFLFCCSGKITSTGSGSKDISEPQDKENVTDEIIGTDFIQSNWNLKESFVGSDTLLDVTFVNKSHGLVASVKGILAQHSRYNLASGGLFETRDGGDSWNPIQFESPADSFVTKLCFIDESRGWIVLQREQNVSKQVKAQFWVFGTIDGGQSWRQIMTHKNAHVSKLTVQSDGEGWIVGAKVGMNDLFQYHDGVVFHTADFGKSWQEAYPRLIRDENGTFRKSLQSSIEDIQVAHDGQKLAILNNGIIYPINADNGNWEGKLTAKTVDSDRRFGIGFSHFIFLDNNRLITLRGANYRGSTWSKLTLLDGNQIQAENAIDDVYLLDIKKVEDIGIFACGYTQSFVEIDKSNYQVKQNGIVLFSVDGKNWERIYEKTGILHSTTNGGETWETTRGKNVVGDFFAFTKIASYKDEQIYVVGNNGAFVAIWRK